MQNLLEVKSTSAFIRTSQRAKLYMHLSTLIKQKALYFYT